MDQNDLLQDLEIEDLDDIVIGSLDDVEPEEEISEEERMAARRRRRARQNQQTLVVGLAALVVLVAVGLIIFVPSLLLSRKQNAAQAVQQQKVDDLLASEGEIQHQDGENFVIETEKEPTAEEIHEQKVREMLDAGIEVMTLEDKVAGLFIVTPEALADVSIALRAGDATRDALLRTPVGGLIYFSKNIDSAEQFKEMIETTKSFAKYPLFVGVDEEGGSVSRLAASGLAEESETAQVIGQSGDPDKAYQTGVHIGTYLSEFGFNLDFAPVADINAVDNNSLGSRTYGSTPEGVTPYVLEMIKGLKEQNVVACVKHFPGMGSTSQDTHDGIALTEHTKEQFYNGEFKVFQDVIDQGAQMIMVGHISAPYLTVDSVPCSLSSVVVTDILRDELGFDGVIVSDAMNMSAISEYYSSEEAAVQALKAGCDMVLMPENFQEAYNGVLQAVKDGVISEERINDSLRRIYTIKYADKIKAIP
jgi:beta-N-acetylhexosaminidase